VTFLRSSLFFVYFILVSVAMHIVALPTLILPRLAVVRVSQAWSRMIFWGLKWIAGCDYEVRGDIPKGAVLVAAKHMSMWDTLALYLLLDDVCVVVKRELLSIPFYGWYIKRSGVIGIDRAGKAAALRQMAVDSKPVIAAGRPIAIFPEGHRHPPGAAPDYKPGVAGLYTLFALPCVPVALNSGQFWLGFTKRPGTIVIEFLPPIAAGLKRAAFMTALEERIETATNALLVEGKAVLSQRCG
jgi:1-acyl-sn-glycerol-3-phosphate acyltransferase